jgi:hypothetical protein
VIWVPECGGVPDGSMTCAITCVVPLTGKAVVDAVIEMVEPDGASSGTFWQPTARPAMRAKTNAEITDASRGRACSTRRRQDVDSGGNMKNLNILMLMKLRGQAQEGYAMAALLVGMSVMRKKQQQLAFRDKACVHGIALFQRKFAGAYPPNLKVLVEQKFVRKNWKDPITDDDFVPIPFGQQTIPTGGSQTPGRGTPPQGTSTGSGNGPTTQTPGQPGGSAQGQSGRGGSTFGTTTTTPGGGGLGIQGVTSKSKDESIRIYNGRTHYNEWQFVYTAPPQRGGGPGAQGGPGQPGGQPGQQPGPFGGPGQPGRGGRGQGNGRGFPPGGDGRGFPPGGPGRGPGGQPFPQPAQPGRGRG